MTHHTDNDEVRRVEQMREACAKALRETADASGWKPADGAGPVETGIFFSRINALREGADLIETLPLPACATGDDAAQGDGWVRRPTAPGYWLHRFDNDAKAGRKPVLIHVVEVEAEHFRSDSGGRVSPPCPFVDCEEWRPVPNPDAPSRPADDAGAKRCAGRGFVHNGGGGGRECPECYRPASPPYPLSPPADDAGDAVREALRGIKALSLAHHAHEDPAVLLHALLVEIPAAIDNAAALLAAERAQRDAGANGDQRGAGDRGEAVRVATNALRTAIKARRAAWRSNNSDSYRAACRAVERAMHAVITETDLDIAAAERAQDAQGGDRG